MQEHVQLGRIVRCVEPDGIGRHRRHIDGCPERHLLDDAVVEEVLQHSADGADGER